MNPTHSESEKKAFELAKIWYMRTSFRQSITAEDLSSLAELLLTTFDQGAILAINNVKIFQNKETKEIAYTYVFPDFAVDVDNPPSIETLPSGDKK